MQSAYTIPPYVPECVDHIVGLSAKVSLGWDTAIVVIERALFISSEDVMVTVKRNSHDYVTHHNYGLDQLRFKDHCDDPLLLAMHRATLRQSYSREMRS